MRQEEELGIGATRSVSKVETSQVPQALVSMAPPNKSVGLGFQEKVTA